MVAYSVVILISMDIGVNLKWVRPPMELLGSSSYCNDWTSYVRIGLNKSKHV